jgi:Family of unknown function (DUF5996)
MNRFNNYDPWPELPYKEFKPTAYLLHMGMQIIGKLKLATPFEPQWANVALWITSRGLTTGLIPYGLGTFSIDIDLISHHIDCTASWGRSNSFKLAPMSVAKFNETLFNALRHIGVNVTINPKPQEVPDPILFNQDTEQRPYAAQLANAWWRILVSSHRVMQQYHALFTGKTAPIGLMWGTFDLRDARYNGMPVATTGANAGYFRRNSMNEAQVETGWWIGSDAYPRPAYFSFTYPQPEGINQANIMPDAAHWDNVMQEFILDYDAVRSSTDPEKDLLAFLNSTYEAGAVRGGWDKGLIGTGKPI